MAACGRCGGENPEGARFCASCGAALAAAVEAPREARKLVTVLFTDVSGSTNLAERLDPETVRRVMGRYFDEMRAVIERHEGTVEKFIGDAIMAVFGIPAVHEDDALRAVRAAVEMRRTLEELNGELEREWGVRIAVCTGINTGEVVAGDATAAQLLVTGDAVNVAARLQQAAEVGEVLIGRDTYLLLRDAVQGEPIEPLQVKGKEEPIDAYRLAEVTPGAALPARHLDSPLVDRLRELELLGAAFDHAVGDRACRLMTVIGAAGVGKSRLASEAITTVDERATVLVGRCLPYGEGITYWPLVEAVKQAGGIADADAVDAVRAKLATLVEDGEDAPLVADRITQLLGVVESVATNEQTFWSVRRLLEAMARRRPVVLVLEDVHWAQPTLLDLVEYLGDWCRDAPLLVLCLARPDLLDEHPTWARKAWASTVLLEPLADDDTEALIQNRIGDLELDARARARVREAAEGNPLFIEQMLAMLAEGGSTAESAVPPTIQSVLAARLDRLTPDERLVIEGASVMGRLFWWEALEVLLPGELGPQLSGLLMALVRKEMIVPERDAGGREHGFRFRHILIRDAAYAGVPQEARSDLHRRFAEWLDPRPGEWDEIVGYHLEQAHRLRTQLGMLDEASEALALRAGERLGGAGRRALARGDMPGALNLLGRATSLLPEASAKRMYLLPPLAEAASETGDLARADGILRDVITAAAAVGDRGLEALAEIDREYLREYIDPTAREERVLQTAEGAIRLFEELGNDHGLAKAWTLRAQAFWDRCRYADMEGVLERALVHAERADDKRGRSLILNGLTRAALLGPAPVEEALQRSESTLAGARGDPALEAVSFATIGHLKAMVGRFDEARASYRDSRAIGEEFGRSSWLAALPLYSGPIELLAGDPAAAERELRAGYDALIEMGDLGRLSTEAAFLAQALYAQERYEEAEYFTGVCEGAATPDDMVSQIAWRGVRSKALARKGELRQAELLAREAVTLAEETDGLNLHGDALLDLADVLLAGDRPTEAVAVVKRALSLYERKGNLVSAARTRAALAER
ncbi:MAG: adenylate/guanylate cyclase domain-containing protein [Gaiellaceae bacterium]